ncbi:hypothetical protein [Streptomyces xiaopingdaonensis]|uniref:hypothetical protein n=1 Tax=Streptomyces xiaopingdaonensis TaxID=1565415 RepID=UPI000315D8E0|nr:hypothetical protein [Streptomyces xiaopingdaonensis]
MIDAQEPAPCPPKVRTPLQPAAEGAQLRVARVTWPSGEEAARYADVRTALFAPRFSREGLPRPDAARTAAGDSQGAFAAAPELRAEGLLTAPLPRLPVA